MRRMAIIGSDIYAHSAGQPETYKLFDGTSDGTSATLIGISFKSKAVMAYRDFGNRFHQKNFLFWATEGLISSNTTLTHRINYDFDGFTSQQEKEIKGSDANIIFTTEQDASLGNHSLGDISLAGDIEDSDDLPKFRVIQSFPLIDFFEVQEIYESDDVDQQWQILATGPAATVSANQPVLIKQ